MLLVPGTLETGRSPVKAVPLPPVGYHDASAGWENADLRFDRVHQSAIRPRQSSIPPLVAALPFLLLACQTGGLEPASASSSASKAETQGARSAPIHRGAPNSVSQARFDPNAVQLHLEPVATGVRQPTFAGAAYDGSGRLFVVEKAGRILILRGGQVSPRPFLDISDRVGSRSEPIV